MAHRVLRVHDGHAVTLERPGELAGPGDGHERVLVAVLDQHRDVGARPPSPARTRRGRAAPGSSRARPIGRGRSLVPQRQGDHHPGALGEARRRAPATARSPAPRTPRRAGRRARRATTRTPRDRTRPAGSTSTRRSRACPAAASGPRGRTAQNWPSGSRCGQQPAEVPLVGAVPVDQQQEALGVVAAHHVRHERSHANQPTNVVPGRSDPPHFVPAPAYARCPCDLGSTSAIRTGARASPRRCRRRKHAERLGYHSVWTAEAYGTDAVTPLTWLMAQHRDAELRLGHHADAGAHARR